MGQPRDGMPVASVSSAESPSHALPGQSFPHVRVVGQTDAVIVSDEIVVNDRPESGQSHGAQQRTNEEGAASVFHYQGRSAKTGSSERAEEPCWIRRAG